MASKEMIRIQNYGLGDIKKGIRYLLDKAAESPDVRQLAIEVTQDKEDQIAAIYDWIKDNVKYIPDPDQIELFISPVRMVNEYRKGMLLGGDCDDMAILAAALYRSIGIPANVILIDSTGGGLNHAFCQVRSNKLGWTNCDPSAPLPIGWEVQYYEKIVV